MAVKRDPVIVAPDQMHPDEWMVGDITWVSLTGVLYVLTVRLNAPPKGLDWNYTKETASCAKEIAAYHARVKAKATPQETKVNAIWDAVEEFSKQ